MNDIFDVIMGMGRAGEVAAERLAKAGKRLAVVNKEPSGGETWRR